MKYTNKIKGTLKLGDIVIFNVKGKTYEYKVKFCYLKYKDKEEANNTIFKVLNLNKCDFCTKHYGYNEHNGCRYKF